MNDQHTLFERAKAYDEYAIGELYDQYAPLIYNYLHRRVLNAQVAEDLTGDVFFRVLQAIQSDQIWHTSFRGWLYRIAHNLVIDYYRKQPTNPAIALSDDLARHLDGPDSVLTKQATYHRLHLAIRSLTPDQQQILALRFGEQLAAREVAEIMNKSVGAVEVQQHRALASLRRILEKGGSMSQHVEELLEKCLERTAHMEDIEAILRQYPQQADQLRPLLETAIVARRHYSAAALAE